MCEPDKSGQFPGSAVRHIQQNCQHACRRSKCNAHFRKKNNTKPISDHSRTVRLTERPALITRRCRVKALQLQLGHLWRVVPPLDPHARRRLPCPPHQPPPPPRRDGREARLSNRLPERRRGRRRAAAAARRSNVVVGLARLPRDERQKHQRTAAHVARCRVPEAMLGRDAHCSADGAEARVMSAERRADGRCCGRGDGGGGGGGGRRGRGR